MDTIHKTTIPYSEGLCNAEKVRGKGMHDIKVGYLHKQESVFHHPFPLCVSFRYEVLDVLKPTTASLTWRKT
jgi:hypothetical protein